MSKNRQTNGHYRHTCCGQLHQNNPDLSEWLLLIRRLNGGYFCTRFQAGNSLAGRSTWVKSHLSKQRFMNHSRTLLAAYAADSSPRSDESAHRTVSVLSCCCWCSAWRHHEWRHDDVLPPHPLTDAALVGLARHILINICPRVISPCRVLRGADGS